LGLNPHNGDGGVIGTEEQQVIIPAIRKAKEDGLLVFGPFAADGFFGSGAYKQFDVVLAMYHDQGLIPFKSMNFDQGVNFTAGLSVVRTSPDHGTGFDIAGKGVASEQSFRDAVFTGIDIFNERQRYADCSADPLQIQERREREGETRREPRRPGAGGGAGRGRSGLLREQRAESYSFQVIWCETSSSVERQRHAVARQRCSIAR
jgi:hypothetical protein